MEDDRLVRRLGSGHAGEVFEAVIGGRVYALKLVSKPAAQSPKHTTVRSQNLSRDTMEESKKALIQNFPRLQTPPRLTWQEKT